MHDFPAQEFDAFNETDVREEVIAPLLKALGYRTGTRCNVVRELPLRYPRRFLGRKDLNKDPPLRGKADYMLEVDGLVRWVIEAKAPQAPIGVDQIEQAWTYASHAEVRAVYFALCNGRSLHVYQTQHGPEAPPVLTLNYEELPHKLTLLQNVLGAQALIRDFPRVEPDPNAPIGPGLRSVVRITNGLIRYDHNSIGHDLLNEIQTTIVDGAVERDENGKLVAYLNTMASMRSFQELNERLGLAAFEVTSDDSSLSIDPEHPTAFFNEREIILPQGERILDLASGGGMLELKQNIRVHSITSAVGVLTGRQFGGRFVAEMRYPDLGNFTVALQGPFIVHLA